MFSLFFTKYKLTSSSKRFILTVRKNEDSSSNKYPNPDMNENWPSATREQRGAEARRAQTLLPLKRRGLND